MTALATSRNTVTREGKKNSIPVKAGAVIYPGAQVVVNGGYLQPGVEGLGLIPAGRSAGYYDNTGGADGDIDGIAELGCFLWENSSADPVDETSLYEDCYIEDDQTVSKTDNTGARSRAGKVVGFEDGQVWVSVE